MSKWNFGGGDIFWYATLRCSLCSTYTELSILRTVQMCAHLSAFALAIPSDSFTHYVFCLSIQISPPITSYSTCFSSPQLKPSKNDYLEMAEMLMRFIYPFQWHQWPGEVRDTVVKRLLQASTTHIIKTQDCTNDMIEGKGPWGSQEKEITSEWEAHKIS